MVAVRGVSKSYGPGGARERVLSDIELQVKRGEIVALLGQSGSGKSTLLNIIGSLDRADQGQITVLGCNYANASEHAKARLRNQNIGFVFQAFHLLESKTSLENVLLPALFDTDNRITEEIGMEALERVGLAAMSARYPGELSGGQRQRVAIARAIVGKPLLLLCDEPTGNLDSSTSQEIIELFAELNRTDDTTLVIATHDPTLAAFAQRVVRLRDGSLHKDDQELSS